MADSNERKTKRNIQGREADYLAEQLLGIVTASWMAQAIYVIADLKIPDLLSEGPKSAAELAASTNTHLSSLRRVLRSLETIGICRERADGSFEMTPMGDLLRTDTSDSLRSWVLFWGDHLWPIWGRLIDSVKTGESARTLMTGCKGFEHLERDPELAATFDLAMAELTRYTAQTLIEVYDFSKEMMIIDLGGGNGGLMKAILTAFPSARGMLFDMPSTVKKGEQNLSDAGLIERCQCVPGNFFDCVPRGGTTYILKSVLHDWDDDQVATLFNNCRAAMDPGSRQLIIERMMPERLEPSFAHRTVVRSDLTMLVARASWERSEHELEVLLSMSGFRIVRNVPARLAYSIIEAVPR
jgi:orsellinic acid C2-O-methyltransferase